MAYSHHFWQSYVVDMDRHNKGVDLAIYIFLSVSSRMRFTGSSSETSGGTLLFSPLPFGPPAMVATMENLLRDLRVPQEQIMKEAFPGY